MSRFEAAALTHMLVVSDADASRDWYVEVLDASLFGEYGGTSVVLELLAWIHRTDWLHARLASDRKVSHVLPVTRMVKAEINARFQ